jgi:hypothetical protein
VLGRTVVGLDLDLAEPQGEVRPLVGRHLVVDDLCEGGAVGVAEDDGPALRLEAGHGHEEGAAGPGQEPAAHLLGHLLGAPRERRLGAADGALGGRDVRWELQRPARAVPLAVAQADAGAGQPEVGRVVVGRHQVARHRGDGGDPVGHAHQLGQHEPRPDVELDLLLEVLPGHLPVATITHAGSLGGPHGVSAPTAETRAPDRTAPHEWPAGRVHRCG